MREDFSGWFVEVPRDLKKRFKELYPGRSAQRRVTLAAIEWAIQSHPSLRNGDTDVKTEMQGTDDQENSMHVQSGQVGNLHDAPQSTQREGQGAEQIEQSAKAHPGEQGWNPNGD